MVYRDSWLQQSIFWAWRNTRNGNVTCIIYQTNVINAHAFLKRKPIEIPTFEQRELHVYAKYTVGKPQVNAISGEKHSSRAHAFISCLLDKIQFTLLSVKSDSRGDVWIRVAQLLFPLLSKNIIEIIKKLLSRQRESIRERERRRTERLSFETSQRPVEAALSW